MSSRKCGFFSFFFSFFVTLRFFYGHFQSKIRGLQSFCILLNLTLRNVNVSIRMLLIENNKCPFTSEVFIQRWLLLGFLKAFFFQSTNISALKATFDILLPFLWPEPLCCRGFFFFSWHFTRYTASKRGLFLQNFPWINGTQKLPMAVL